MTDNRYSTAAKTLRSEAFLDAVHVGADPAHRDQFLGAIARAADALSAIGLIIAALEHEPWNVSNVGRAAGFVFIQKTITRICGK